ncbi:single-stranded-DNA-specific exonuclease RecJ [Pantoea sp. Nvir]|uniref:single-stranded-DNA-specific exonuclease RecJ n=1 Tax=Pantoea sp. Nvir TaxID=2576760 RepID=UPI001F2C4F23|nr:single-stranded-DNA-specific exonuclease RecJ [Pantoea sp. Nvir]
MIQSVELRQRDIRGQDYLPADLPPLLKKIYLHRGVCSAAELERSVRHLLPFTTLKGLDKAVELLHKALINGQRIMVIGDFDVDGAASIALTVLALRSMGGHNVQHLVPNRFEDGYGLSPKVVEYSHVRGTQLILTVDNGISSHGGVECAHRYGIPVLITDHHLPGETLPEAEVIVNPNLNDCAFPSRTLAGVGVAFYVMMALRAHLRKLNWFDTKLAEPNLAELLDLVALGTVADLVPLDFNNRILVWQGINRIRANKCRPGIRALIEIANRDMSHLVANDLTFGIGPRLNAAGRLNDMSAGVALLLTEDIEHARMLALELNMLNQKRKEIEQNMQSEALSLFMKLTHQQTDLPLGLAFYHPTWHQGVIGILAARLKEYFYRPVIAFAPAGDGMLKGSGRSIPRLHLYNALEKLKRLYPGLISKFGGHAMAAGLLLKEVHFEEFRQRFAELMGQWLNKELLQHVIWSDGTLQPNDFNIQTAELLREAGPWGKSFPEPIFNGKFKLLRQILIGERHLKMIIEPLGGGPLLNGIAFNIDTGLWPDKSVQQIQLAFKLDINEFHGNRSLQLRIEHIWPLN